MNTPFLVGNKIYLRPLEIEDLERCVRWINNEEINQFLLVGRTPFNRIREEEWLRSLYKDQRNIVLAIVLKAVSYTHLTLPTKA